MQFWNWLLKVLIPYGFCIGFSFDFWPSVPLCGVFLRHNKKNECCLYSTTTETFYSCIHLAKYVHLKLMPCHSLRVYTLWWLTTHTFCLVRITKTHVIMNVGLLCCSVTILIFYSCQNNFFSWDFFGVVVGSFNETWFMATFSSFCMWHQGAHQ